MVQKDEFYLFTLYDDVIRIFPFRSKLFGIINVTLDICKKREKPEYIYIEKQPYPAAEVSLVRGTAATNG